MNRLIIIGNGFDLAHGLNSSYHDFLLDYLKSSLVEAFKNKLGHGRGGSYNDDLININISNSLLNKDVNILIIKMKTINDFIRILKLNKGIEISYKSLIIRNSLNNLLLKNWVDIENEYYKILKENTSEGESEDIIKVERLNNDFSLIKKKLESYLVKEIEELKVLRNGNLVDIAYGGIEGESNDSSQINRKVHFLNFNYTYIVEDSIKYTGDKIDVTFNYIHGELKNPQNPIIFGFGDEYDEYYATIKNSGEKEYLKFIKSFSYFQTRNYSQLVDFIENSDFEVFILGHSCGLSDRTLLRKIFEHNICKKIKIFYRIRNENQDDYTEKTYKIARHFRDDNMMRDKIVNKEDSECMPNIDFKKCN